jgi:hypothetical protein
VSFWKKFFNKKKIVKTDKSPYFTEIKEPKDIMFAKKFTIKGGRFLLCENNHETTQNLKEILKENLWTSDDIISLDDNLSQKFNLKINLNILQPISFKVGFILCEFLISNTGLILLCDKQIKHYKMNELPKSLIIVANSDQFASDVSQGMTMLKNKYKKIIPTNITTVNIKNYLSEEVDTNTESSNSKNIYLLLQDF